MQNGRAILIHCPFRVMVFAVLPAALRRVVTHCPCRAEENLQFYCVDVYLTDFFYLRCVT
ncbi:MAG: hypothetical protein LBL62_04020 [Planctomycetaceae bacterium]|nr:hypothetical protein [Planctomycetaceae bacterium]